MNRQYLENLLPVALEREDEAQGEPPEERGGAREDDPLPIALDPSPARAFRGALLRDKRAWFVEHHRDGRTVVHGADIRWVSLERPLERSQQQQAVGAGTTMPVSERSFERLQIKDLRRVAASARENLNRFVEGNREKYGWCENHIIMLCLCQGAAEHYARGERGVKDFDVWAFYEAKTGEKPFPWRRNSTEDFGSSRFGRNPCDEGYIGRRIDVFGRSITRKTGQSPENAVLHWVHSKGKSARCVVSKPIVAIYPD